MARRVYDAHLGADTDDAYAAIIAAHEGLSLADSHALNARLVLLMANAIGDVGRITDLCETARAYSDRQEPAKHGD
ncbi:MAG: DUF2783 domain-containing protein [Jannaschia sp.]